MTLRLALDMDGPIADLHKTWYPAYNKDWDDDLDESRVTDWGLHKFVKPECGLQIYEDYLTRPELYINAPLVPGAADAIKQLMEKHSVYILTHAYLGPAYVEKAKWVNRHLPFLGHDRVWFCKDKFMFNADIILDDNPEHLEKFPKTTVCWDMPYNRHVQSDSRLVDKNPVDRWLRFLTIVDHVDLILKRNHERVA